MNTSAATQPPADETDRQRGARVRNEVIALLYALGDAEPQFLRHKIVAGIDDPKKRDKFWQNLINNMKKDKQLANVMGSKKVRLTGQASNAYEELLEETGKTGEPETTNDKDALAAEQSNHGTEPPPEEPDVTEEAESTEDPQTEEAGFTPPPENQMFGRMPLLRQDTDRHQVAVARAPNTLIDIADFMDLDYIASLEREEWLEVWDALYLLSKHILQAKDARRG